MLPREDGVESGTSTGNRDIAAMETMEGYQPHPRALEVHDFVSYN
jgi:hypothetical protein